MNCTLAKHFITQGGLDRAFEEIYGAASLPSQRERYCKAIEEFEAIYGDRDITLYCVPGRSELSGNHTDHNRGCVIAASVDLDIIAVAAPRMDNVIRIKSRGFSEDIVDISQYRTPIEEKLGTSEAIIAGMCEGFSKNGYKAGGFCAYTVSNVLTGSGLSSSAAFEVMVGNILNHMYNDGKIDNIEIAKLAKYSENVFFGKPSGLMDQVACAAGGIVAIDFENPESPKIERLDFDLSAHGYSLCIVNTGTSHADLTDDYTQIPREMKAVASHLGGDALRDVSYNELLRAIPTLRGDIGDRAILRALHFLYENERVEKQKNALLSGDLEAYLELVTLSGRSSFCYLQNVYSPLDSTHQGLSLALCLAEKYLEGCQAAYRVHGGGFAGTVQAYVPNEKAEGFRTFMENIFGKDACTVLHIRKSGAARVL